MRCKTRLASSGLALLVLASGPVAQGGEAPPYGPAKQAEIWTFCVVSGIPIPGKTVVRGPGGRRSYFSAIWRRTGPANDTDLGAAFGAFIAQKYGLPAGMSVAGQCTSGAGSRADAEKTLQYWKDSDAKYNYGGERIDTGWQYSPAPPAAS